MTSPRQRRGEFGRKIGMLPNERLDYSPISQRKRLALPGGARLALWVIVNVEEWDINETMPRTVLTPPAGGSPMPDIPVAVFVPRPIRDVRHRRATRRRGQDGARHRLVDVPFLDIDDDP